jgi:hypothetical protein
VNKHLDKFSVTAKDKVIARRYDNEAMCLSNGKLLLFFFVVQERTKKRQLGFCNTVMKSTGALTVYKLFVMSDKR